MQAGIVLGLCLILFGVASFATDSLRAAPEVRQCNGTNGITNTNGKFTFSQLHVGPDGMLRDSVNCVVRLHGINWAGNDFQEALGALGGPSLEKFQWFHKNENTNIWRIWVNASWWNNNYPVPAKKNMLYRDWIKQIVAWANQSGAYVLLLKGAQWPGYWNENQNAYAGVGPCGAKSNITCGNQNTASHNCTVNPKLCWQRGSGLTVGYSDPPYKIICTVRNANSCDTLPTAITFWKSIAPIFAQNQGVMFGSWNEMHEIDCNNWKVANNQLISTIRTGAPNSIIFFGGPNNQVNMKCLMGMPAQKSTMSDFKQPNLVYDFHVYNGGFGKCPSKLAPTSALWTQFPDYDEQVIAFARKGINPYGLPGNGGHGFSISEWGGDNVPPCELRGSSYDIKLSNFAKNHNGILIYYSAANLVMYKNGVLTQTETGKLIEEDYSGW